MLATNIYLRIHVLNNSIRTCTYLYCVIKSVSFALGDSRASCYYQHEWVSQHESDAFAISVRYLRVNALAADRPLILERERERERERTTEPRSGL